MHRLIHSCSTVETCRKCVSSNASTCIPSLETKEWKQEATIKHMMHNMITDSNNAIECCTCNTHWLIFNNRTTLSICIAWKLQTTHWTHLLVYLHSVSCCEYINKIIPFSQPHYNISSSMRHHLWSLTACFSICFYVVSLNLWINAAWVWCCAWVLTTLFIYLIRKINFRLLIIFKCIQQHRNGTVYYRIYIKCFLVRAVVCFLACAI